MLKSHWLKIVVLTILTAGCTEVIEYEPVIRYVQAFNTAVQISVYDTSASQGKITSAVNVFEKEVLHYEYLMNHASDTGALYRLNNSQNTTWDIPEELHDIIEKGIQWGKKSDGLVDITIKPVMDLYVFTEKFKLPDSSEMQEALEKVNYSKLKLSKNRLYRDNLQLDLTHLAKGYTIYKASKILLEREINDFLINAGGVIQFQWTHPELPATIYIRHPRQLGKFYGQFHLNHSCGLATAADYQKWTDYEGTRYHHLISPKTGKPVSDMIAISVIAANAFVADYYATYLFLLGHEKAKNIVTDHRALEAIIIWQEMGQLKHWISAGLIDNFEYNEIK